MIVRTVRGIFLCGERNLQRALLMTSDASVEASISKFEIYIFLLFGLVILKTGRILPAGPQSDGSNERTEYHRFVPLSYPTATIPVV